MNPDARTVAHELRLGQEGASPAYFHGQTMRPHLVEGDEVVTEPVTAAGIRVGDVVTYRYADRFPTRRVMGIDPAQRTFTIMGDSIPGPEQFVVPFDDVLARVVRRRRDGRWLATTDLRWRAQTALVLIRFRYRSTRLADGVWAVRRRVRSALRR